MDLREHKRRLKLMMPDDKPKAIAAKERPRTDIYVMSEQVMISQTEDGITVSISLTGRTLEILTRELEYLARKNNQMMPERAN